MFVRVHFFICQEFIIMCTSYISKKCAALFLSFARWRIGSFVFSVDKHILLRRSMRSTSVVSPLFQSTSSMCASHFSYVPLHPECLSTHFFVFGFFLHYDRTQFFSSARHSYNSLHSFVFVPLLAALHPATPSSLPPIRQAPPSSSFSLPSSVRYPFLSSPSEPIVLLPLH